MESKGIIVRKACSATLPVFGCHPGERHTDPEGSTEDRGGPSSPLPRLDAAREGGRREWEQVKAKARCV